MTESRIITDHPQGVAMQTLYDVLMIYDLMPFHLSVFLLILLSMAETAGYYIGLRPSSFLKRIAPKWLSQSPLVQIKFSKVLILVFTIECLCTSRAFCTLLLSDFTCTDYCRLFYCFYDSLFRSSD